MRLAQERHEPNRICVRPVQIVDRKEHAITGAVPEPAQHPVIAGGPVRRRPCINRILAKQPASAHSVKRLHQHAERQAALHRVTTAHTHGQACTGGTLTRLAEHRCLAETCLAHQEKRA